MTLTITQLHNNIKAPAKYKTEFIKKFPKFIEGFNKINEVVQFDYSILVDVDNNFYYGGNMKFNKKDSMKIRDAQFTKLLNGEWSDFITNILVQEKLTTVSEHDSLQLAEIFNVDMKRINILRKLSKDPFTTESYGSNVMLGSRSITKAVKEFVKRELELEDFTLFTNTTSDKMFRILVNGRFYDFTINLKTLKTLMRYEYTTIKELEGVNFDNKLIILKKS